MHPKLFPPSFSWSMAEIHENLGVRLKYIEPHPNFFMNFCHLPLTHWEISTGKSGFGDSGKSR
ncbi:hypothetical protein HHJ77_10110 [Mobiluncus mulieris]|uniref:Uncharacterized protein n=1 Tax=Mobiluncus mulieris TaxID=2052 RepID=A0A7Y0UUZ5_9ACTO|nr:hypothetical protein [Mobiluncus mulieris]NMX11029.1 hypothetical protein [Mobiluncus mulieris]